MSKKHYDGLGVPDCLFDREAKPAKSTAMRGELGVPMSHLFPGMDADEARRRLAESLRRPAIAEGEG